MQHVTKWNTGDMTWKLIGQQEHQEAWNWTLNAWGRVLLMVNGHNYWVDLIMLGTMMKGNAINHHIG